MIVDVYSESIQKCGECDKEEEEIFFTPVVVLLILLLHNME